MNNTTFEDWSKSLENMVFDQFSLSVRDKILEGDLEEDSKKLFIDCYDYVYKVYKSNKPLDVNLLKIYLEQVKGYEKVNVKDFVKVMVLLAYCGFSISAA